MNAALRRQWPKLRAALRAGRWREAAQQSQDPAVMLHVESGGEHDVSEVNGQIATLKLNTKGDTILAMSAGELVADSTSDRPVRMRVLAKRGRKPSENPRSENLSIMLTKSDRDFIDRSARRRGEPVSTIAASMLHDHIEGLRRQRGLVEGQPTEETRVVLDDEEA